MRGKESIRKKQVGMKHPFFKQAWLPAGGQGDVTRAGKQDGQGIGEDRLRGYHGGLENQC